MSEVSKERLISCYHAGIHILRHSSGVEFGCQGADPSWYLPECKLMTPQGFALEVLAGVCIRTSTKAHADHAFRIEKPEHIDLLLKLISGSNIMTPPEIHVTPSIFKQAFGLGQKPHCLLDYGG